MQARCLVTHDRLVKADHDRPQRPTFVGGIAAAFVAAVAAVLVSNNWCFVCVPAGIVGLVTHRLAGGAIRRVWTSRSVTTVMAVCLAVAAGCLVARVLRVSPEWAFQEALGTRVPDPAREIQIQRHYLGGPGEHALIIQFTAGGATIESLASLHPFERDNERIRTWAATGCSWAAAWRSFGSPGPFPFASRSLMRIPPFKDPQVFDFGLIMELGGSVVLIYEPDSGRALILHVRF